MTPGARIQAATELLDRIERPPPGEEALPADAVLNAYFRARRYVGAKDRRASRIIPADKAWRAARGGAAPFAGPTMMLTPHRHRADRFFAAVLERA